MTLVAMTRVALAAAVYLVLIGNSDAQVSAQLAQKAPDSEQMAADVAQDGYARVIVQFASPVPADQIKPNPQILAPIKAQIASAQDAIIASHFGSAANPSEGQGFSRNLVRFKISPMFAVNVSMAELNALAADPRVLLIHYNTQDPPDLVESVPLIGMPAAYAANATGVRQAVAIMDTGLQTNHVFLSQNMVEEEACFSNAGAGSLCPDGTAEQIGAGAADATTARCINNGVNICTHGTHVAGIAAGDNSVEDGAPENGVAKNARIIAIQVFSRVDNIVRCGGRAPCVLSGIDNRIRAFEWLFTNALTPEDGVRLAAVNMSIGGGTTRVACDNNAQKPAIDALRNVGVASILSAGNLGRTDQVGLNACISTAIAVASSTKGDAISEFSNMASLVALVAPGGFGPRQPCNLEGGNANILSSVSGVPGNNDLDNETFGCKFGTSMAAPHVAGAFAAIRTVCANATVDRILAALEQTGLLIRDTRPAIPLVRPAGSQTKPRIRVNLALQAMGCAVHDFNGDGKSDIVWRDTSGNTAVWLMNGAQLVTSGGIGAPPLAWSIVGQRDFNGDGKYDLLWRDTSGNTAIWFMNGVQVASMAGVGNIPTTWSVVGTGNFDGKSKGGILWRDSSGNVSVWLMNGAVVASSGALGNVPTATWSVAGTGDFDGDGKTDILWRDNLGNTSIWFMNGVQVRANAGVGNVPPTFSVVGTGDFNGDGRADIVWRDNAGNTSIWLMDGAQLVSVVGLGALPNVSLAQVGDYNGDGLSDLLWRDALGNTSIWFMGLMNGQLVVSTMTAVGNIPPIWTVQSVNAY
jgi:Subtilase family/FG-GAP-like repeat